tara:strand:+ start:217 stop:435 length:219 start_codon:yes stop_codon:yes gene_type:complete
MAAAAAAEDTPKRRARLSARQPPGTIHGKTVFATFFLATGYLAFCFFSPTQSSQNRHAKGRKVYKWWTPSNR